MEPCPRADFFNLQEVIYLLKMFEEIVNLTTMGNYRIQVSKEGELAHGPPVAEGKRVPEISGGY